MNFEKIHNKGQAHLFDSEQLESLTKTHPLVIFAIYIPAIIYMLHYSAAILHLSALYMVMLFLAGVFTWTLFEYFIHRFVFHYHAGNGWSEKLLYILHGNHHEYPRDKQRLFMPAFPSMIISSFLFMITYLIAGMLNTPGNIAYSFFPGFLFGYLLYGSMHYAIHAWHPPFRWMKSLWRNHHLHHYKEQEKGFGVSSTFWDHVFGSMFDLRKEKEDKAKVDELIFPRK
jgi:sterol desaturase/sphingolipid hydroxylase (fatty acid hydroxylase superfamily)